MRAAILGHLNATVDIVLERVREKARLFFNSEIISVGNGTASPFSKVLFPQIKLASLVERSFSASIGTAFNYIARDLVRSAYGNGEIEHIVEGDLPLAVATEVEDIVSRYRGAAHTSPDTPAELQQLWDIWDAHGPTVFRRVKCDLFFRDHGNCENYLEIKTPMPNYDTCKAVKNRILLIHALRRPLDVRAVAAFPFNPNGVRGVYAWPPTKYFLDPAHDWAIEGTSLMGSGLWNLLGDSDQTFTGLMDCCQEVFEVRNADVIELMNAVTFGAEEL